MTKSINKYKALRLTNLDEDLNKNEKLIYGHLILCFNEIKGYSYPAYPELMKVLGVKRRNSVSDAVENLRYKRYIKTEKGYRGQNNYYLLKHITSNESVTSNENDTRTSNESVTPLVTETLLNKLNNKLNNKFNIDSSKKSCKVEKSSKDKKHKYGEYNNVLLTNKEKEKLIQELGEYKFGLCIKKLDEYIEETGKKYKNHNLTIRRWVIEAIEKDLKNSSGNNTQVKCNGKVLDLKVGGE